MNTKQIISALTILIVAISILMICGPVYRVWASGMRGRAELNRATYNRQVLVQESIAKEEASKHLGAADTVRAHCIARSNEIIGQSLNNNENYLKWLWIDEINKNNNVMYVATEIGLPVLEAGRLPLLQAKKDSLKHDTRN